VRDFKSEIQRHAVSGSLLAAVQASTRTSLRILYPTALSVGFYLVPEEGLEPSRGCPHRILSPKNLLPNDTQEGQAGGILKGSRLVRLLQCPYVLVDWAQLWAQCRLGFQRTKARGSGSRPLFLQTDCIQDD
jgi:hypothetical protein